MSASPSMPLFIDAYLADTTHLSTEEHGAYMLLLMAMWRRNAWVPNDDKDLARIVGMPPRKWAKVKARLMPLLIEDNGELTQKKLKKEWDFLQLRRVANAANGALGGRPRSKENKELPKAKGSFSDNPNESPHIHTHKNVGTEEVPTSSEPEKPAPSVVMNLPTVSEGEVVPIFETDVEEWQVAFPGVDVRQQLAAMRSWLLANPTKRKTKKGMRRFVVSWLDKRQNAGPLAPVPRAASPPNRKPNAMDAYREIARLKGWNDEPDIVSGTDQNAQRFSPESSGSQGVVVDLRRGSGGDFGPSDLRDGETLPARRCP